jgi:hypothetical protein
MKTWMVQNLRTLVLAILLFTTISLICLQWYNVLIFFLASMAIIFAIVVVFGLLESASDEAPLPVVDLRVLQKHPNVADVETLRLRYLQETGRVRPRYLDGSVSASRLDYLSWVENLATQMLVLLEHVDNEKR